MAYFSEQATTTPKHFHNSFSWKWIVISLIIILCIIVRITLPYIKIRPYIPNLSVAESICIAIHATPAGIWVLFGFLLLSSIIFSLSSTRNQYILEGDTLIVREYSFFRKEPELRIPLATIRQIKLRNPYLFIYPLHLDISGIHRKIYATTHAALLANTLRTRLDN